MNFQQHQWIGDHFDDKQKLDHIFFKYRGHHLSFGEVNGLSGDHFDVIQSSTPNWVIPDSKLDSFIHAMVKGMVYGRSEAGFYKISVSERKKIFDDGVISFGAVKDTPKYKELMEKTVKEIEFSFWTNWDTVGNYVGLARRNWHHFMPLCMWAYYFIHSRALTLAATVPLGLRASLKPDGKRVDFLLDPKEAKDADSRTFARALFLEGCGCHFLEDCFAGGHVRTLRIFYGTLLDAMQEAKGKAHDVDNLHQINVTNALKKKWSATGEHLKEHFFDDGPWIWRDYQLPMPRKCVLASVSQLFTITDVSKQGLYTTTAKALQYVPQLSMYWIPVHHDTAAAKGYRFQQDEVSKNSCVLHMDLGHNHTDGTNIHEIPQNQVIVADLSNNQFRDFYFFQRERNGIYDKQEAFPEVHNRISHGDPVILQNAYFPLGKRAKSKITTFPPKYEPNDLIT
jgi:hypothetical protein